LCSLATTNSRIQAVLKGEKEEEEEEEWTSIV
jgi:hypothetical protein